jgi:hypothetical protein
MLTFFQQTRSNGPDRVIHFDIQTKTDEIEVWPSATATADSNVGGDKTVIWALGLITARTLEMNLGASTSNGHH